MIRGHRVVAVEEHLTPPAYLEEAHRQDVWPGDSVEMDMMRGVENSEAMHRKLTDVDLRVEEMDACGIDTALLSVNTPGVQPYDENPGTSLARTANDLLAEAVARHPDRLGALGTVAPQNPGGAAQELERIMGPLGLNGLMINSHTHGRYLDEGEFTPLLEAAEALGATLYLHPRVPSPQMRGPYLDYGMMAAIWGYQAEAGTHAMRLILGGTFDRHPGLKVVLGHLGEGLPFWLRRLDNRHAWASKTARGELGVVSLELTPSEYVRRNFVMTTSGIDDHDLLAFCLQSLGEDNLMFAIDTPYEESASAARFLHDAVLTEAQRAKISHQTAEELFRLPTPMEST